MRKREKEGIQAVHCTFHRSLLQELYGTEYACQIKRTYLKVIMYYKKKKKVNYIENNMKIE